MKQHVNKQIIVRERESWSWFPRGPVSDPDRTSDDLTVVDYVTDRTSFTSLNLLIYLLGYLLTGRYTSRTLSGQIFVQPHRLYLLTLDHPSLLTQHVLLTLVESWFISHFMVYDPTFTVPLTLLP